MSLLDYRCKFVVLSDWIPRRVATLEPIVQYGPFVMNTAAEIQQAFYDYRSTQFGGWPWDENDNVHARELGRFAKYADGKVEEKKMEEEHL